jgi:hypothetical protein
MDVQALAATPLFFSSLTICALVTAFGIAKTLRFFFGRVSRVAASAGLLPRELEAVESAGIFHNQLEGLIEDLVSMEELSSEMPAPFSDHSWVRLVELCEDLEVARADLHTLLNAKDFVTAYRLGHFLTGGSPTVPELPPDTSSVNLTKLALWHANSRELLQRMVSKVEDAIGYNSNKPLSPQFYETLDRVKDAIIASGDE